MDPNLPSHWEVIDTRTMKVVDTCNSQREALARCEYLEPEPEVTCFRYTMQPVRRADSSSASAVKEKP